MSDFVPAQEAIRQMWTFWRLPQKLNLADWADKEFVLSAENSAEAGRWTTLSYQRGILNAISDPTVTHISFMKSARVGATKMMCVASAYYVAQDPTTIMFVQPTIDSAAQFSKEEIAVMFRDVPALQGVVTNSLEGTESTISHKMFRGGSLSLVGANSGTGFRRVSRRVIFLDEVDSYPPSAGDDGDPVRLAIRRSEMFWNRKIFAASTPLIAGHSRIEKMFEEGDQRRYFVPCPQCGYFDTLVFSKRASGGHFMVWPEDKPEEAHFVCSANGCVIEHHQKFEMLSRGEWRASKPFNGHASFHISALYSYSPNASWGAIAREFLDAKRGGVEQLRVFVNTVLGETWRESGDAPDWERLYRRRESYPIGSVPHGVTFLTAGVDVQKDRVVYEVRGWGAGKESWSIDAGVIPMDTANESDWIAVDELLSRTFHAADGTAFAIRMLAIDSGFNTQMVYNWVRRHERNRVVAIKGVSTARTLISSPTAVDVKINGQRISRGAKVWPIGVDIAKSELYGLLRLSPPAKPEEPFPAGYIHHPEYAEEYFKQLTSEQLVTTTTRHGFQKHEWTCQPGRENHFLDTAIYNRAAAAILGVDRLVDVRPRQPALMAQPPSPATQPLTTQTAKPKPPPKRQPVSRFLSARPRGKSWLGR